MQYSMGRFLTPPKQELVSMYQPQNIDFYAGILNKAQQDLERGTAIKAAAIEKYGDLEFSSKEDMDAVIGRVQDLLKGATDADFVSPSKVTNAVLQANREVMPGVQAVKAKAKAADMYDRMRVQYGPNFWGGTDPRTQSILDQTTGKYVDPNQFKAVGINAEEVDKLLLASQQQELNYSYDEPTKSDLPGYLKINKYTGLSDDRREKLYRPGTPEAIALAKSQLATMPQLREVFGSDEAALSRLMERNYQTTGNYKQTVDSQYLTDRNYIDADTKARLRATQVPPALETPGRTLYDIQPGDAVSATTEELTGILRGITNPEEVASERSGWWKIPGWDISANAAEGIIGVPNKISEAFGGGKLFNVPDINKDGRTAEDVKRDSEKKIEDMAKNYPALYKANKLDVLKKYKPGEYKLNKDKIDVEINTGFLTKVAPIESSLRMMQNELRALSPTEIPKLYDDMLINLTGEMPLKRVEGSKLGKEVKAESLYGDKDKFNETIKQASIVVNPVEGRVEITVPGEDAGTRYALSNDLLDEPIRKHMEYVSALNKEYIKILRSGQTPPTELMQQIRFWTDDLYRNISETYSK